MPEMTPAQISEVIYDADIRIDRLWPFPVWNAGEDFADVLSMFVEEPDDLPEPLGEIIENWSEGEINEFLEGSGGMFMDAANEFASAADNRGVFGFIGQVSSPIKNYYTQIAASYSWGAVYHKLIFGATMEEFINNAIAWAEKTDEEAKAKAGIRLEEVEDSDYE